MQILPSIGNKKPHILKPNQKTELPTNIICLDTEAKQVQVDSETFLQTLWLGWAVYHRRDRNKTEWKYFETAEEFFKWMEEKFRPKVKFYVFAHNFDYDAQILNLYDYLSKNPHYEIKKFIVDSNVFIIKAVYYFNPDNKKKKAYIEFLSTTNYTFYPLSKIGEMLGIPKMDVDPLTAPKEEVKKYCKRDVEILLKFVLYLIQFIEKHDLGNFQPTIAKQSFNTFRHRFMKHQIYIHADPVATALERLSYRGGRNEAFFIGTYEDPKGVYYLDVNSMYPYVMREFEYPTKLVGIKRNIPVSLLKKLMKDYLVIADVLVKINVPAVGIKRKKLIFPIGQFRAYLTSPELELVLKYGEIKKVYTVAVYEKAKLFEEYVNYFYNLRVKYKKEGNVIMDKFAKIFMNSLYGKFGQRNENLVYVGEAKTKENIILRYYDTVEKKWKYFMAIDGKVYTKKGYVEAFDSFVAIASFVTAYARCVLWKYMEKAGLENVLYVDTDSLFVNHIGYERLKPYISDTELGKLKIEKQDTRITIHGAKDYEFGGSIKLKGIKKSAKKVDNNTYEQIQFIRTRGNLLKYRVKGVLLKVVRKKLNRNYDKGEVTSSGWVKPYYLNEEG